MRIEEAQLKMKRNLWLVHAFGVVLVALLIAGCTFAPPMPTPETGPNETAPSAASSQSAVVTAPPPPAGATVPTDTVGRLIVVTLSAPSLKDNLFGDPVERPLAIYLPPTYFTANRQYPVVYFLAGFGDQVTDFISGVYGLALPLSMDSLIMRQRIREMILVVVSGRNYLGGSFYTNSPVTGNWEDFIVKEIVPYVDSHYRTLARAESRGISGHSMGGSGSLSLAMHHPGVFGAVYSLSPGVFNEDGLSHSQMFASPATVDSFLATQARLEAMPREQAGMEFGNVLEAAAKRADWDYFFTCAYGAAFAPDPKKNAPYLEYPYRRVGAQLSRDDGIWKKWEGGFGGVTEKIDKYRKNLQRLKAMVIDYGTNDEYRWIPLGCEYLSHQLDSAGITHRLVSFPGGHQDKLGERMQEYMLPFLSDVLVSDGRGVIVDSADD